MKYVFLRIVLKYCKNKPEFVVDRGTWYLWAFKRLGLRYRHETFDDRNAVEGFFSLLKESKEILEEISIQLSLQPSSEPVRVLYGIYNYWRSLS